MDKFKRVANISVLVDRALQECKFEALSRGWRIMECRRSIKSSSK